MTESAPIRHTLRLPTFRGLLGGGALYFIGNAMQVVPANSVATASHRSVVNVAMPHWRGR